MLRRIGLAGLFGLLVVAAGLGIVAWENPRIGAGIALMIFGFGIAVRALISRTLARFGMMGGPMDHEGQG